MWETVRLGEICDVLDSLRKPITKKDRIEGDYPYYGATGIVDWVHDYIFEEKLVLVGEDGAKWEAGDATAFIANGKYWVNNHAHVLRPKPDLVIHEWISYYLTGIDLSEFVTGLTVPKLNQANLKIIPIPLPPLAEQQRIVAKLEAAFAEIENLIANKVKKIDNLQALKSTILSKGLQDVAVMWKTVKLGASCKMYQPKTISAKEMVADGEYVVFGANGIIGRYHQYNHAEPQLLVTCRGATCGAVNVSEPFSWINGNAMVIQPDLSEVSLKYMEYLFRGGIDLSKAITGAAQPQITRKSLEPIKFSYPPLAEQQRIVAKLEAAFAELNTAKTAIAKSQENYQALKSAILAQELQSEAA